MPQNKPRRVTERRIVDVLVSYLRAGSSVAREVGHYEKRIDIVTVDPTSGEVWAIEAKTTAWPRAIGQAIVNLSAAERSYIAVYAPHAHRVSREALQAHGIGLIAVGTKWGDVKFVVDARKSQYQNRLLIDRLRSRIIKS